MEELIDVLDNKGNKTGIIKKKSDIKKDGDYHRAIAVLVINNNNEILMQKRSSRKRIYPNLWSIFVKGHVQSGESSIDACIRELSEEIGINIEQDELKYLYTIFEEVIDNDYIERIFYDTYILRKDFNLNDITIQEEELSDIKLVNYDEVISLIKNNDKSLVPNFEDYKRIIKYLKNISC